MMTNQMRLLALGCACAFTVAAAVSAQAADASNRASHVRSSNARTEAALQYALTRSPSFQDLIETLNLIDRIVIVEDGHCGHREQHPCLQLVPESRTLLVQVDAGQPIGVVAAQIAHALYHAVEVGREPEVADAASLHDLYERIGERRCFAPGDCSWDTRAARAFEALVTGQLTQIPPAPTDSKLVRRSRW